MLGDPTLDDRDDTPSYRATNQMLRICLGGEAPMVAATCRALETTGVAWWDEALRMVGCVSVVETLPSIVPGRVDLSTLQRWKEAGKTWTLRADPTDAPIRGTLIYLIATAIAVRDHETSISSRPPEELIPAWLDLAEVAPEPWKTALAQAALKLGK